MTRLSPADLHRMYLDLAIHEIGRLALARTLELHPEPYRTYVVDRNINYANYCTAKCLFCNFKADPPGINSGRQGLPTGYILTKEELAHKIEALLNIGGTQILMQGGLVPARVLPFSWYLDLLRFIKREYPAIHIHAFSPPEIWGFTREFKMPLRDVLLRLREAGLDTIPGGGGEILSDRLRKKIGKGKGLTADWLEVMRQAHRLGMMTSATMMFGHLETLDERIEHLRLLRELQDESLAYGADNGHGGVGSFTAFIGWTFQPENTPSGKIKPRPVEDLMGDTGFQSVQKNHRRDTGATADGQHLQLAGAYEYLKMNALARLFLDNIPNLQSSWVTQGPKIGQLALFFGANDMGSVMMEENVVSKAGAAWCVGEKTLKRLITDAGWVPQQRDQYYRAVNTFARRNEPTAQPPKKTSAGAASGLGTFDSNKN